jgi:aldehyde:ferredoxin oxidoreductase
MFGWMGTILRVDLGTGNIEKKPLNKEIGLNYAGGRGINARILYNEVKPGLDAFDPENRLIFGTGPFTGTMLPSGRINITGKSPMTGILGNANGGSHFSPELKFAGYDHIVFFGKAEKPVYLWINDDRVELRDAQHLWGKTIDVARKVIQEELGDPRIQIACIGPAGEKLVRLANVMVGDGSCSRTGMGAVMGSKNLKAVAVRGTKGVKVARPEVFWRLVKEFRQRTVQSPNYPGLSSYGSTRLLDFWQRHGSVGMRNTQETGYWAGYDKVSHETLDKEYFFKPYACFGCPIHCRHRWKVKEGPYAGERGPVIEVGPIISWGPNLDNSYAPAIFRANTLCNQYGIDLNNCGEIVGAATEWYQRGLITKEDTDGIELEWGNYEAMLAMIPKIANREGIGDLLANGGVWAAKKLGKEAEKSITQSKGGMWCGDDSRFAKSFLLGLAVATRGADHLSGATVSGIKDWTGTRTIENGTYEGQARLVYETQLIATIADSLEVCKWCTKRIGMEMSLKDMAELFSAATGLRVDEDGMKEVADRIWTLERAFIVREGVSRKDDILVGRLTGEPPHGGPLDGIPHDQAKWDKMLDEYYGLVGWDKKSGEPTRAKLEALGLKDVADELESTESARKERYTRLPWV